eukprot:1161091-Pelagomonas_calceolata.AAC.4
MDKSMECHNAWDMGRAYVVPLQSNWKKQLLPCAAGYGILVSFGKRVQQQTYLGLRLPSFQHWHDDHWHADFVSYSILRVRVHYNSRGSMLNRDTERSNFLLPPPDQPPSPLGADTAFPLVWLGWGLVAVA